VVEGAALEMLFRGNFNEGSNPSLSVLKLKHTKAFKEPPNFGDLFLVAKITLGWVFLEVFRHLLTIS
jgi:hypothetical protein